MSQTTQQEVIIPQLIQSQVSLTDVGGGSYKDQLMTAVVNFIGNRCDKMVLTFQGEQEITLTLQNTGEQDVSRWHLAEYDSYLVETQVVHWDRQSPSFGENLKVALAMMNIFHAEKIIMTFRGAIDLSLTVRNDGTKQDPKWIMYGHQDLAEAPHIKRLEGIPTHLDYSGVGHFFDKMVEDNVSQA